MTDEQLDALERQARNEYETFRCPEDLEMANAIAYLRAQLTAEKARADSLYHSVINAWTQANDYKLALDKMGCIGPDGVPFTVTVMRERLAAAQAEARELREALNQIKKAVYTDRIADCDLSFTTTVISRIDAALAEKGTP